MVISGCLGEEPGLLFQLYGTTYGCIVCPLINGLGLAATTQQIQQVVGEPSMFPSPVINPTAVQAMRSGLTGAVICIYTAVLQLPTRQTIMISGNILLTILALPAPPQ